MTKPIPGTVVWQNDIKTDFKIQQQNIKILKSIYSTEPKQIKQKTKRCTELKNRTHRYVLGLKNAMRVQRRFIIDINKSLMFIQVFWKHLRYSTKFCNCTAQIAYLQVISPHPVSKLSLRFQIHRLIMQLGKQHVFTLKVTQIFLNENQTIFINVQCLHVIDSRETLYQLVL